MFRINRHASFSKKVMCPDFTNEAWFIPILSLRVSELGRAELFQEDIGDAHCGEATTASWSPRAIISAEYLFFTSSIQSVLAD